MVADRQAHIPTDQLMVIALGRPSHPLRRAATRPPARSPATRLPLSYEPVV